MAPVSELREATVPEGPATRVRRTIPHLLVPPTTELGSKAMLRSGEGNTVSVALLVTDPKVAMMSIGVLVSTTMVFTTNVTSLRPAGTTTVVGTVTPDSAVSETNEPCAPEFPVSLTISAVLPPPIPEFR